LAFIADEKGVKEVTFDEEISLVMVAIVTSAKWLFNLLLLTHMQIYIRMIIKVAPIS